MFDASASVYIRLAHSTLGLQVTIFLFVSDPLCVKRCTELVQDGRRLYLVEIHLPLALLKAIVSRLSLFHHRNAIFVLATFAETLRRYGALWPETLLAGWVDGGKT